MKSLITILFISISIFAFSQRAPVIVIPYDSSAKTYSYKDHVANQETEASVFYEKAKKWILQKYSSATYELDEAGKHLVYKGKLTAPTHLYVGKNNKTPYNLPVDFGLHLKFKKGAVEILITNIMLSTATLEDWIWNVDYNAGGGKVAILFVEESCNSMNAEFNALIAQLKEALMTSAKDD